MSSKEKKSRKFPDDEETKRSGRNKKQKTCEPEQDSTTKQPVPSCSSATIDDEENASSTEVTVTEDLKSELEETEKYKTARLKNLLHGIDYQLKLLIYFIQRGLKQYTFALATEMADAANFDDLVFRYRKNGEWVYRFLQAKHIRDINKKKITDTDLLCDVQGNNNFGLKKYFESFRKIKTHETFKNGKFEDFIICTNIGVENNDYFKSVEEIDEILNFKKTNAKLLKFDFTKFPEKEKLKSILVNSAHDVLEDEMTDFFDKLVFAVDMPNEERLGKIIAKNMSREFNLKDSALVANDLYIRVLNWMKSKEGYFFKNQRGETCFEKIKLSICKLKVNGITYEYCEKIKKYGMEFENIASKLSNFLNGTERIFILISPCSTTRLSAIKVIQALKGMSEYKANDSFISMYLSSVWSTLDLVKSTFESEGTHNLLVVECEDEIKYDKEMLFKTLSSVVENSSEKKLIFITHDNDPLAKEFENNLTENVKWSKETDEKNSLTDLKQSSLEKLWMQEIFEFQGEKCVSLKALSLGEKSEYSLQKALEGDLLFSLIEGSKNIKIGKAPKDLKYDTAKDYFIDRTFSRYEYIDEKIDLETSKFCVISREQDNIDSNPQENQDIIVISDTDEKFNLCCGRYANKNIHWLKQNGNNYIWQQSNGSVSELLKFMDLGNIRKSEPNNIMAVPDKVVLIVAEPGMGKSVILSHLAINTPFVLSRSWIVRCNLVDYSTELRMWKSKPDVEEAIKLLYKITEFSCQNEIEEFEFLHIQNTGKVGLKCDKLKTMKLSSLCLFEIQLFTYFLNQGNIALLLDGFDEISPLYEDQVIKLIDVLKCHIRKIWMTTRPLEALTKAAQFGTFPYQLDPFTHVDQRSFLEKYWKKELKLVELNEQCSKAYINELLRIFSNCTSDFQESFGGFPLQMYMIANISSKSFEKFHDSGNRELTEKDKKELQIKLNLNSLYKDFIKKIYDKEQRKENHDYDKNKNMVGSNKRYEKEYQEFLNVHTKLAVWTTLEIAREEIRPLIDQLVQKDIRSGICVIENNKPNFIHLTFAEYFTADYIWEEFKTVNSANIEGFINSFLIEKLVKEAKQQICAFLSSKVQKDLESDLRENIIDPEKKLETLMKVMLSQNAEVELFASKHSFSYNSRCSFSLLLSIIETMLKNNYEVEITNITGNFEDAYQHKLLLICAKAGYEELAKALTAKKKMDKEFLLNFLKDGGWSHNCLIIAIENDHLNIANLFTEMHDESIIKNTLQHFINTILYKSSIKFLEYLWENNIFEVDKPYTINNEQKLLLFEVFKIYFTSDKKAFKRRFVPYMFDTFKHTSDKLTFLIDKTDIGVIDKYIDSHGWDKVIGQLSLHLPEYDEEVIKHAMKKGINFSNAVNIILYECITFPINYSSPKHVKHCLKMIKLLFESGASYNCKNIDINTLAEYISSSEDRELDLNNFLYDRKCKLTTLQYSKQIYLTYKILNIMINLLDEKKCEMYCSINKIFKLIIITYRKCDQICFKVDSKYCLIPCYRLESPEVSPMKTGKEIRLSSFGSTIELSCELVQQITYRDIPKIGETLVKLHSLINEFRDIIPHYFNTPDYLNTDLIVMNQIKSLYSKLSWLQEYLLKEVVMLSKRNDYCIDSAFKKISEDVHAFVKFLKRIKQVKQRSHDYTLSLTADDILSIWESGSETTDNDALQNVTSEMNECGDIPVICNALTTLLDNVIDNSRIPKNMSNVENESKCFHELLRNLDTSYHDLTNAIITANHEEIKTIMERDPTYKKSIINGQDEKFGSPLHYVVCKGDVETANLLLSNGANPNLRLNETDIPERLSTFENLEEMRGSEDWQVDYYSWTPLHLAALNGCNEIVRLLIDVGARINVQVQKGDTPLHLSSMRNHFQIVQLLLQNGACHDVKNSQNKTPLQLAQPATDVAKLLLCIKQLFEHVEQRRNYLTLILLEENDLDSLKAILHAKNSDNYTLLNIAQANEHEEMVNLLHSFM
ncbi:uncharacterized protein LOC135847779 [Planococcus citri]|uniref:uncharacterized protein LOC135847779 n=1 Tax=Planococcus citri TaxID=170843 RepID=UPI0031F914F5